MTRHVVADRSGAAAVEFALISPILIVLFWGIISYGGYFFTAHTVQQLANDAARAAVAGLDDAERTQLARDCVTREAAVFGQMQQRPPATAFVNDGKSIAVSVTYDGTTDPFWAFGTLGVMPSTQLTRTGIVLLGGF
jgi:Flp pilus assembly protein TadG